MHKPKCIIPFRNITHIGTLTYHYRLGEGEYQEIRNDTSCTLHFIILTHQIYTNIIDYNVIEQKKPPVE